MEFEKIKKMIYPVIFSLIYIILVVYILLNIMFKSYHILIKMISGGFILVTAPAMVYIFIKRIKDMKNK